MLIGCSAPDGVVFEGHPFLFLGLHIDFTPSPSVPILVYFSLACIMRSVID
jgi:hypothetical protein